MKSSKLFLNINNEPKKLASMLIFVIAALLFIIQILKLFYFNPVTQETHQTAKVASQQSVVAANSPVFTLPLFGDYVPDITETEIRQSKLNVEIVGIMYASDKKQSQVLILDANGEEKPYLLGDTLPGGAEIKQISKNRIVVLHNGELESLSLPQNELLFEKPAKPLIGE